MNQQAPSTIADDGARPLPVENIGRGEFVKRKADAKKVFKRGDYNPSERQYELIDCDDINHCVYVKRGTILFVGFTY